MWGCVCACMHVWGEGGVVWLFAGILDIRIFVIWSFSPQQASSACSLYPSHWEKKGGNDNRCEYKAREQECAWRWFVITTPWFSACVRARRFQFCLVRQRQDNKRSKVELSSLRVKLSSYDKRRRWGANQPLGEGEKKKKKACAPQSLAVAGSLNRCQLSSTLCINERKCCGSPKKTPESWHLFLFWLRVKERRAQNISHKQSHVKYRFALFIYTFLWHLVTIWHFRKNP